MEKLFGNYYWYLSNVTNNISMYSQFDNNLLSFLKKFILNMVKKTSGRVMIYFAILNTEYHCIYPKVLHKNNQYYQFSGNTLI